MKNSYRSRSPLASSAHDTGRAGEKGEAKEGFSRPERDIDKKSGEDEGAGTGNTHAKLLHHISGDVSRIEGAAQYFVSPSSVPTSSVLLLTT